MPTTTELAIHEATHITFLRELELSGALTPTSLDLGAQEISFETYEALCGFLGSLGRSFCWWVGDLINWGETVFGEEYAQGVEALGLSPGTCVNYAYTCRQVARSRRRLELSFAHHRVIAPLRPDSQRDWLEKAVENSWTRSEFAEAVTVEREALEPDLGFIEVPPSPLELAEAAVAAELHENVMEVVRALAAFQGEIGHDVRCWIRQAGQEYLDCVCGLTRLEAAVAALGVEW